MKTPRTNNKKIRTPSGTVISNKVKDIRGFFDSNQDNINESEKTPLSSQEFNTVTPIKRLQRSRSVDAHVFKQPYLDKHTEVSRIDQSENRGALSSKKPRRSKTKANISLRKIFDEMNSTVNNNNKLQELEPLKEVGSSQVTKARSEIEAMLTKLNMQNQKKSTTMNAAQPIDETDVVTVTTVISMFKRIEERLTKIENSGAAEDQQKLDRKIAKINTRMTVYEEKAATHSEVSGLSKEVQRLRYLNKIQTGTIQRMSDVIEDLMMRMDNIELTQNKKMLTLSNFPVSNEKEEAID